MNERDEPYSYEDAIKAFGLVSEAEAANLLVAALGLAIYELDYVETSNRSSSTLLDQIDTCLEGCLDVYLRLGESVQPQQTAERVRRLQELVRASVEYRQSQS